LGHLLLEASSRGAETAPVEEPLGEGDAELHNADEDLSLDDYPAVRRLRPLLAEDRSDQEFAESLESLLEDWTSSSVSEPRSAAARGSGRSPDDKSFRGSPAIAPRPASSRRCCRPR